MIMGIIVFGAIMMLKVLRDIQKEKKILLDRVMAVDYQKFVMGQVSQMREENAGKGIPEEFFDRGEQGLNPI